MGHRNLIMLIRHYGLRINPGELTQETLVRLGAVKTSSNQLHPDPACSNERETGATTLRLISRFGDSVLTSRASLSSRSQANFECRRWLPSVHSAYSICATSRGLSHRHSSAFHVASIPVAS
jgi:hypothetical protein